MGDKWGQSEEENVSVWVNALGGSQKLTLLWLSFSDGSWKEKMPRKILIGIWKDMQW